MTSVSGTFLFRLRDGGMGKVGFSFHAAVPKFLRCLMTERRTLKECLGEEEEEGIIGVLGFSF